MERTGARYRSFRSADLVAPPDRFDCRVVAGEEERTLHLAIRRVVFVEEQGMFDGSDWDRHDEDPATLHVVGLQVTGLRAAGEHAPVVIAHP